MRNTERRRQFFHAFEAKALKSRSLLVQIADELTGIFGSPMFLVLNGIFFYIWITVNLNWYPNIPVFDPYPFGLLTMIVSLEAIFLSIFVLVSQNRSSYVNAIREEVHLRVNLIAEEEVTKLLEMVAEIRQKVGIKEKDPELEEMIKRIDTNYIERSVAEQMKKADISLVEKLREDFPDILTSPVRAPIRVVESIVNEVKDGRDNDKDKEKSS